MTNIKIGVACHKPSELPKNELFLPIHVGAALSDKDLKIQRDDEGENISKKNPQYCELTAQYWLWKNVKADYYGLCHYRRFLCFNGSTAKQNNRFQIESSSTYANMSRFGLEDAEQMREIIEKYDVVTGMQQKVSNLYTPYGPKRTAMEHWIAHDRALIMKDDLEKMLNILKGVSPDIHASAIEYMNGPYFSGFNCFVMKKEFFFDMCKIEFEVLERLEKEIDFTHYNQQLTRIYGFMAEIISSSYIYHLGKKGKKVLNVPLVYFNYTDKKEVISPQDEASIPVIFNCADDALIKIAPILESFFENMNKKKKFDLAILEREPNKAFEDELREMVKPYDNVSMKFVAAKPAIETIAEQASIDLGREIKTDDDDDEEEENKKPIFSPLPLIPYIFEGYKKALVFDENILFRGSVDGFWEDYKDSGEAICAPREPLIVANVNDIYPETAETYLRAIMDNPYDYFSSSSMLMNFEKIRKHYNTSQIVEAMYEPNNNLKPRQKETVLNVLFCKDKKITGQELCVYEDSNQFLKDRLPYMPFVQYKELQEARKKPVVLKYQEFDPWANSPTVITTMYWKYARKTSFYGDLLRYSYSILQEKNIAKMKKKSLSVKVFAPGSKARLFATKLIPRGSKRYAATKKVMSKLKIK